MGKYWDYIKSVPKRVHQWLADVSPPIVNPDSADPLFVRLEREATETNSGVKRFVSPGSLDQKRLITEIVRLMFNLSPPERDLQTNEWIKEALSASRSLRLQHSIFYVYVDNKLSVYWDDLDEVLRSYLIELSKEAKPLHELFDEIFVSLPVHRLANEHFNPEDKEHCNDLKLFLPCHLSKYRKSFPSHARDWVFIVGRSPIHDHDSIRRYQQKLIVENERKTNAGRGDNNNISDAQVAITVRSTGHYKDKRKRLNAHSFKNYQDTKPQTERKLYLGDWRRNWELTMGAAEYDEIQCSAFDDESYKVAMSGLTLVKNHWEYDPDYPQNLEKFGVEIKRFAKIPNRLLDYLARPAFPQELVLTARGLPNEGGEVDRFNENAERQGAVGKPVNAAIEIYKDVFWLVKTSDEQVFRVINRGGIWSKDDPREGERVPVTDNGVKYMWKRTGLGLVPPEYYGLLYIDPSVAQIGEYVRRLPDEPGDELRIAHGDPFNADVNPDRTLGDDGVVSFQCLSISEDGRASYVLLPTDNPMNPSFAFRQATGEWLSYAPEKESGGDLHLNDMRQVTHLDGKAMVAERYSYSLACGTSFFQIKISGTPPVGSTTQESSFAASPTNPVTAAEAANAQVATFEATDARHVKLRLLNSDRWKDYDIISNSKDGQSNVAMHYIISNKKVGDERFLKAYYAHCADNAEREARFYTRFRDRYEELFLQPPDDILRNAPNDAPWALVFPLLKPFDEWLPALSVLTLSQASAIAFALAKLFKAMDAERQINFDIDPSTLCLDGNDRLVIVDFDNVFSLPEDPVAMGDLAGVRKTHKLPAKNTIIPPEGRDFLTSATDFERDQALRRIGTPYTVYMTAVVSLQLLDVVTNTLNEDGATEFLTDMLVNRAINKQESLHAAKEFETLLHKMLNPVAGERPSIGSVVAETANITRAFALHSPKAREEIEKLLGSVLEEE